MEISDKGDSQVSINVDKRSGLTYKRAKVMHDNGLPLSGFQSLHAIPKTPIDGRQLPSMRHEISLSIANPPSTPEQEEDLDDDDDSSLYLDDQSNLDISGASEIISTSSRIHLEETSLPPNVSSGSLYKYIPKNLDNAAKLRQIIYWAAKEELRRESTLRYPSLSKEESEIKAISYQLKLKFLDLLANGEVPLSWVTTNPTMEVKKRPNPRNVKNQEKIKRLEYAIDCLKREEEEWRRATRKLYEYHARTVDQSSIDLDSQFDSEDDYLQELEHSPAIVEEALRPVEVPRITNDLGNIGYQICYARQMLHTADVFQMRAKESLERIHHIVGQKLIATTSRIAYEDYEENTIPRCFEDTEEKIKKIRNKVGHKLLLALVNQKRKEVKDNKQNDLSYGEQMDESWS
ncbi:hypothetical protein AB4K20DRAFT_1885433 [Rhizopus microsporus]|uniref:Uncharacterized protein n=2 Tax=Rhizopus TaxID=4842 RepID=A0A1X0S7N0_RHIZD|nr:hypothetical protein BCV71DRAFT_90216 [Rhizopus microsporus]